MPSYPVVDADSHVEVPARSVSEYLRECAIYFTTEAEEQHLPQVLEFVGEDRVMISVDMPHGEAREGTIEEIEERADLTATQKRKLLADNATRFYGLPGA